MRNIFAIGFGLLLSTWLSTNNALAEPTCTGNYLLEKTFTSGAKWQLCWEHRQREGIIYHDFYYTPPAGLEIKILNQANMAQIHVPYDDNGARYHDVSDYGLGGNFLNNLQSGDCPDGELRSENNVNMICMLTRQRNHAHASHVGTIDQHAIGQYFEIFSVSHVGAYNYIPTWRLYDDGTIEVAMGATGSLQRFRTGSQYQSNGWLLNDSDLYGVSHQHNYYWRLDFDLGSSANDDVVEEIEFISQSDNLSRIKSITPFTTEAARSIAPERYRSWQIRDGVSTNASGHSISYQIEPLLTGHRDEGPSYEPWTLNDFYVTVNNNCEKYASHNPEINGCSDNLSTFVNGENLTGADVVIWYGLSFHHIPRDEDEPKMHAHWNSFKITPRNVTTKNPLTIDTGSENTPPVLTNPGDQLNYVGETISLALTASDANGDSLSYSASGLPGGLSITENGNISGIPTTAGISQIIITANDGIATDQETFNWTIDPSLSEECNTYHSTDVPIAISSAGTLTIESSLNIVQNGIITDVNILNLKGQHSYMSDLDFKLTSPAGTILQIINNACSSTDDFDLNLDDSAAETWPCPPIDSGTYQPFNSLALFNDQQSTGNWILTITDSEDLDGGNLDQWALEICLKSAESVNQPPALTSPGNQSHKIGEVISLEITANDPDGDILSFTASNLPSGLQIDSLSAEISGTLLATGSHTVTITADDNHGHQVNTTFDWEIETTNSFNLVSKIITKIDDAEERGSGVIYHNSSDLELVEDGPAQHVGLRYQNIGLPQGATIKKAWIQFQADETNSDPASLIIQAEATDNSKEFSSNDNDISTRSRTNASTNWSPEPWNLVGEADTAQQTPDLAIIVQEIVNREGWQNGNALTFIITGSGERTAESYNGDSSAAPTLYIEYEITGNASLSQAILDGLDDVEERSDGDMYRRSSDLELTDDYFEQKIGLRFRDFSLPQGVTVSKAWIQFQADETTSILTNLLIQAETTGNAAPFSPNLFDLSNRSLSLTVVDWSPPAWEIVGEASEAQKTPDIKSLIQMIVDQPDWNSGNALVIVITGTGERVAESFEGDSSAAPKLFIEYY